MTHLKSIEEEQLVPFRQFSTSFRHIHFNNFDNPMLIASWSEKKVMNTFML
jgi:hypothetical protein